LGGIVKLIKLLFIGIFLLGSQYAKSQASLITLANSMTDQQIWEALLSVNALGETKFGKCRISNAQNCSACACSYYFNGNRLGSLNMKGWGKNPSSGDGTGCMAWKNSTVPACWPSSTGIVCNSGLSLQTYAKNLLMNALSQSPADVCGLPTPINNTGGVSVIESSNFLFVNPSESCANGKVLCGTIKLGSEVAGLQQFTRLPESFCNAAYGSAMKSSSNSAKMITCAQYNQNTLANSVIQEAASMVGQMNTGYDIFAMAGITEMLEYTDAQLTAMPVDKVALYYVVVGKNSNKLPNALKPRVDSSKFNDPRPAGANWIIQADIDAAEAQLANISQGTVSAKTLSLTDVVNQLKVQKNISAGQ
jgi:hypothetical protein